MVPMHRIAGVPGARKRCSMTFDPNAHMLKLKSKEGTKDYLPVQWRLVWFREQCPQGTIDTEELTVDLDREMEAEDYAWNDTAKRKEKVVKVAKGYARYKAVVTDGKGGRATGTKSESRVSFPDFIEKAETGAIGRALAALGYGTQFTGDELDEGVERLADAPVEQKSSTKGQALHALAQPGSYEQHEVEQSILKLEDVKWRAKDAGLATNLKDWQFFNAKTLGVFVSDEKLKNDQARLLQLQAAIMQEASAGAGK